MCRTKDFLKHNNEHCVLDSEYATVTEMLSDPRVLQPPITVLTWTLCGDEWLVGNIMYHVIDGSCN